jgi:hypothetical protein
MRSPWQLGRRSLPPRGPRDPSIGARLFDGERRALPRQINRSDAACSVAAGAPSPAFCGRVLREGRQRLLCCAIRRYRVPRFQYKISASFGSVRSLAAPPGGIAEPATRLATARTARGGLVTSADFCLGRRCRLDRRAALIHRPTDRIAQPGSPVRSRARSPATTTSSASWPAASCPLRSPSPHARGRPAAR